MFDWLRNILGRSKPDTSKAYNAGFMRGRYDSAQSSDENRRLWNQTDLLSAKSANSFSVRQTLRNRSRYEVANNSYCRGITLSLAHDLIGTGPRLQARTENPAWNKQIEAAWLDWATAVDLPGLLTTLKLAKIQDGEGFGLFVTNPNLDSAVQLDIQLIEADQVTTNTLNAQMFEKYWVDGVVLDALGNPSQYYVLDAHPGDLYANDFDFTSHRVIPASKIIHWFRKDRPGQVRGIPEITSSLELFSKLRRFTNAVLAGAEIAAAFSAVLETDYPPDTTDEAPTVGSKIDIERGTLVTLPNAAKLHQMTSENPSTTFEMFERLLLRQVCRCLGIPLNVALGDSSGYNYSSGRLDHLGYRTTIRVERASCNRHVVDRIFYAWLNEAVMIPDLLPRGLSMSPFPHRWFYDGQQSIDPLKDAKADETLLANNMTTLTAILAEQGEDLEEFLQVRSDELKRMAELGIPLNMTPNGGQPAKAIDPNADSTDPNFQGASV